VDPETGNVEVVRYRFVRVINPMPVGGQATGGIVPGIGQSPRACTVLERG
jgi:CO/xanthine dehydrogenase Mo-binding subunit